jgi:nickel/cobalt transporter (NicO) family protein
MGNDISLLVATAATIGFFHTLLGPDHYLPFIVLSKARNWSLAKTLWITFLCGIGHVGSSVAIGMLGIALGIGVGRLESVESARGDIAAWAFMVFGLGYLAWGIYKAIKNKPHRHLHFYTGTNGHGHSETAGTGHTHHGQKKVKLTPWILFTIFVLGPCEPLIPILMFPAADHNMAGVVLVTAVFSAVTILTMFGMVLALTYGIKSLPFGKLEKYTHAIAGATIFLSGAAIVFLGL